MQGNSYCGYFFMRFLIPYFTISRSRKLNFCNLFFRKELLPLRCFSVNDAVLCTDRLYVPKGV